jgi:hypothetical protein
MDSRQSRQFMEDLCLMGRDQKIEIQTEYSILSCVKKQKNNFQINKKQLF